MQTSVKVGIKNHHSRQKMSSIQLRVSQQIFIMSNFAETSTEALTLLLDCVVDDSINK